MPAAALPEEQPEPGSAGAPAAERGAVQTAAAVELSDDTVVAEMPDDTEAAGLTADTAAARILSEELSAGRKTPG